MILKLVRAKAEMYFLARRVKSGQVGSATARASFEAIFASVSPLPPPLSYGEKLHRLRNWNLAADPGDPFDPEKCVLGNYLLDVWLLELRMPTPESISLPF